MPLHEIQERRIHKAETVWHALTDAELTAQYWGHANISDWRMGSPWEHRRTDDSGIADVIGTILETVPPHRLVMTFAAPGEEPVGAGWPAVLANLKSLLETGIPSRRRPGKCIHSYEPRRWPRTTLGNRSISYPEHLPR
ncbi:MAG TPA: SRPBCC domain-containing protein [Pseudonocardiaceae bacterium]|nr:SRPBCC domain-containing protein [Pseudonocardiaceae bacterium]